MNDTGQVVFHCQADLRGISDKESACSRGLVKHLVGEGLNHPRTQHLDIRYVSLFHMNLSFLYLFVDPITRSHGFETQVFVRRNPNQALVIRSRVSCKCKRCDVILREESHLTS